MPVESDSATISTALVAVALQEHIVRNLRLNEAQPWGRRSMNPFRTSRRIDIQVNSRASQSVRIRQDSRNSSIKSEPKKNEKSFLPRKEIEEVEYVLDKPGPSLTLAERLGLVGVQCSHVSELEWERIKQRALRREDFLHDCVICRQELGASQHVLLSCSHVFHKNCIRSLERYTGRKTCPMCRAQSYETRLVYNAKTHYKHKCATRIQAAWRGYLVRRAFKQYRKYNPPNDPRLRKRYYEEKLSSVTDRIISTYDCDVDGFISQLDHDVIMSRKTLNKFDDITRVITEDQWVDIIQQSQSRNSDCSICLMPLRNRLNDQKKEQRNRIIISPSTKHQTPSYTCRGFSSSSNSCNTVPNRDRSTNHKTFLPKYNKKEASKIGVLSDTRKSLISVDSKGLTASQKRSQIFVNKSIPKNISQQSSRNNVGIYKKRCDNSLGCRNQSKIAETSGVTERKKNMSVVLSCTHVFHNVCLEALEKFATEEMRFICPVCRAPYQKRILEEEKLEDVSLNLEN